MLRLIILFVFINLTTLSFAQKFTVSGRVTDSKTGEDIVSATIIVKNTNLGVVTNVYGFYSITLDKGEYVFIYKSLGFQEKEVKISLTQSMSYNVELTDNVNTKDEIEISAKMQDKKVENKQLGVTKLEIESIKKIPVVFGEVDVLKTVTLLPGVISAGEGNTGFSVRGGSQDQNLILLDEATVYNAAHLLGFFSVFNGDAIKDLEVYKGNIPASYGGRLASLIDIRMKEGNSKKYTVNGGIGLLSSRLTVEGPIVKDKSSFIISGRRSYADVFLPLAPQEELKNNKLYFYDFNIKANYKISDKDKIFISGYFGRDVFKFGSVFGNDWGNATATFRWNHLFNKKLFSNTCIIYNDFKYNFELNFDETQNLKVIQGIRDLNFKTDFIYFKNPKEKITFGGIVTHHNFNLGEVEPLSSKSIFSTFKIPRKKALESAVYVDKDWKLTSLFRLRFGLRGSSFSALGKSSEYTYSYNDKGVPFATDTINFSKNEIIKTYYGLEPRVSASLNLSKETAIKAAYNRTFQYIQQASNTQNTLPTDQWIPSGINILPQISDQVSAGYFNNFKGFESSIEVYYKWMQNQIDYRDGALLFFNEQVDAQILKGKGWAYGFEFFLKKSEGKFNGFVTYTWSKSERKIDKINDGHAYFTKYDRRHYVNFVSNYALSKKWEFNLNFVFASGSPITYPLGKYTYQNFTSAFYGYRNQDRLPAYHRMDIGATFYPQKWKKKHKRFETNWNFSVYNVYARENPYTITYEQEKVKVNGEEVNTGVTKMFQVALFKAIPSVTWNFKF